MFTLLGVNEWVDSAPGYNASRANYNELDKH